MKRGDLLFFLAPSGEWWIKSLSEQRADCCLAESAHQTSSLQAVLVKITGPATGSRISEISR